MDFKFSGMDGDGDKLSSPLESCTVMGMAVIPRIFPVNVAVIPRGWSKLLRGYRGN